jgi:ribose transport system substrate-binding protein
LNDFDKIKGLSPQLNGESAHGFETSPMNRRAGAVLSALAVITLAACGCSRKAQQLKVLFVAKALQPSFHQRLVHGALRAAKDAGIALDVVAPSSQDNFLEQRRHIQSLMTDGYQGLILAPTNSNLMEKDIFSLDGCGIPYIIVDTPVRFDRGAKLAHYCGFVGSDNVRGGRMAASFIAHRVATGSIVVIRGIESHQTSRDRERGFREGLRRFGRSVAAEVDGLWDADITRRNYERFLAGNPGRIAAVFACNDVMAFAIARFYEGRPQRPLIVGFDGDIFAQRAVLKGNMDATIVQDPEAMGRIAVENIVAVLRGRERPPRQCLTPVTALTAARMLTTLAYPE